MKRLPLIAGIGVLLVVVSVIALSVMFRKPTVEPAAKRENAADVVTVPNPPEQAASDQGGTDQAGTDSGGTDSGGTDPGSADPGSADPGSADPAASGLAVPGASAQGPLAQAAIVDAVLSQSRDSRRKLNSAIQRVGGCTDLAGAVADMRDVGTERQAQIATVRDADLSALAGGENLRSGLLTALQYALEADRGFLDWAEPTTVSGCASTTIRKQAYGRGRAVSEQAGAAKRRFLTQWNPVAADNGLSRRSADDI